MLGNVTLPDTGLGPGRKEITLLPLLLSAGASHRPNLTGSHQTRKSIEATGTIQLLRIQSRVRSRRRYLKELRNDIQQ